MGETLPLGKIELASLQFFGVEVELSFGLFAFLNIEARSIPLDDVAVRIAKRHFPVEHPSVFSACAADASFVLENFSGRQAVSPPGHNPLNVFRVNVSGPVPAGHFIQSDAEIFQPGFIEVVEVAVGPGGVDQGWNRVD
ncbi:MAG TPA: hypothetical protein VK805_07590 [Candidatus Baltobacteraceae bacterium]|nr:hypothetical protein [Candidatus Baltobacteraceae bacterium]